MQPLKTASCWMSALNNFPRTASALSPNTFGAKKKMPMRLRILRSKISSKCATRQRGKCSGPKKKLDHALEAALPGIYLPLYAMVTFTRMPYSAAAKRARLQDRILYAAIIALAIIGIVAVAGLLGRF